MLLDSIAAAVESQTIITCEQLRNIPKNIKEFVEGGNSKLTSCDEICTKTDLQQELPGT